MIAFDDETIEVMEGRTTCTIVPSTPDFKGPTRRKLRNSVNATRDKVDLAIPVEDALRATTLTETAYGSVTTGRRVNVDDDT